MFRPLLKEDTEQAKRINRAIIDGDIKALKMGLVMCFLLFPPVIGWGIYHAL